MLVTTLVCMTHLFSPLPIHTILIMKTRIGFTISIFHRRGAIYQTKPTTIYCLVVYNLWIIHPFSTHQLQLSPTFSHQTHPIMFVAHVFTSNRLFLLNLTLYLTLTLCVGWSIVVQTSAFDLIQLINVHICSEFYVLDSNVFMFLIRTKRTVRNSLFLINLNK